MAKPKKKGGRYTPPKTKPTPTPTKPTLERPPDARYLRDLQDLRRSGIRDLTLVNEGSAIAAVYVGGDMDVVNVGIVGFNTGIWHQAGDLRTKNVKIVGPEADD